MLNISKKLKGLIKRKKNAKNKMISAVYKEQLKQSQRNYVSPHFEEEFFPDPSSLNSNIELFAFYLPQFHPFPENDKWWGKGFTEWTNVTRARPQFIDHYQPHLPADLGFYDLRVEKTMESQINLAKAYGLNGFIFYQYWFNGHRLMERPLDQFLKRKDWNFKFSVCWANENFTRRWDGSESEVLLEQKHSPENDAQYILDTLKYIKDERYLTIDGRPVLIVYRPALLPNIKQTTEIWRKIVKKEIGKDLFLIYAMAFDEKRHPAEIGFDAAIQFPPNDMGFDKINHKIKPFSDDFDCHIFDYSKIPEKINGYLNSIDFPIIPTVFPSWDNTARRSNKSNVFQNSTPKNYGKWLDKACNYALTKPVGKRSIVAINAWNEWAEGAHLEPDQKYGHAYLRETASTIQHFSKKKEKK